jgi:hypothetical protein
MNKKSRVTAVTEMMFVLPMTASCATLILILILMLFAFTLPLFSFTSKAADNTGTIGIVLNASEEDYKAYYEENAQNGQGISVYVQDLDNGTIYRFPLSEDNDLQGRFEIPYGNYRVIASPDSSAGDMTAYCDSVFNISEQNPDVSITCGMKEIEADSTVSESTTENSEETVTEEDASSETEESTEKRSIWNYETIFTMIVFLALFVVWFYNRKFRFWKDGIHRNPLDDD